jgi:hypothetical protein
MDETNPGRPKPERQKPNHPDAIDERRVKPEQLQLLWGKLTEAGQHQAVELLSNHIAALEDEITSVYQYYEEFLIPQMEGRGIGHAAGIYTRRTGRGR